MDPEFRLDRASEDVVTVQPILGVREFDVGAAYTAWIDSGKPLPPQDEARRILGQDDVVAEGLRVTGKERIRPPAKALTVSTGKDGTSQE